MGRRGHRLPTQRGRYPDGRGGGQGALDHRHTYLPQSVSEGKRTAENAEDAEKKRATLNISQFLCIPRFPRSVNLFLGHLCVKMSGFHSISETIL